MTAPLIPQPLAALLRSEWQRMRAHDVHLLRAQTQKYAERLRALAQRAAQRFKARASTEGLRP